MNHPFRKWAALLLLVLGGAVMGYFLMRKPATPDSAAAPAGIRTSIRKIVVLNSDALEALRILGADDRIVGVYSDIASEAPLWPDMAAKPHVGKWSEPNIEAIARLAPDVVIHYSGVAPHLETKLQPLGIGVLRMDLFRIDTLAQEMLQLGQALGKQPEAQRFNAWQQDIIQTVRQQTAPVSAKARVYLENYGDYRASGPGSGMHQLCEMANGLNVAASLDTAYPRVAPEWIVAENPDIILKLSGKVEGYKLQDSAFYNQLRDRLAARPAWSHIQAVKDGKVHVMNDAMMSGPRAAIALAYMAKWMYPAHMQGIYPDALHRHYMETFLRKPFQGRYFSDPHPQQ